MTPHRGVNSREEWNIWLKIEVKTSFNPRYAGGGLNISTPRVFSRYLIYSKYLRKIFSTLSVIKLTSSIKISEDPWKLFRKMAFYSRRVPPFWVKNQMFQSSWKVQFWRQKRTKNSKGVKWSILQMGYLKNVDFLVSTTEF